jgi:hypothetical protein
VVRPESGVPQSRRRAFGPRARSAQFDLASPGFVLPVGGCAKATRPTADGSANSKRGVSFLTVPNGPGSCCGLVTANAKGVAHASAHESTRPNPALAVLRVLRGRSATGTARRGCATTAGASGIRRACGRSKSTTATAPRKTTTSPDWFGRPVGERKGAKKMAAPGP